MTYINPFSVATAPKPASKTSVTFDAASGRGSPATAALVSHIQTLVLTGMAETIGKLIIKHTKPLLARIDLLERTLAAEQTSATDALRSELDGFAAYREGAPVQQHDTPEDVAHQRQAQDKIEKGYAK